MKTTHAFYCISSYKRFFHAFLLPCFFLLLGGIPSKGIAANPPAPWTGNSAKTPPASIPSAPVASNQAASTPPTAPPSSSANSSTSNPAASAPAQDPAASIPTSDNAASASQPDSASTPNFISPGIKPPPLPTKSYFFEDSDIQGSGGSLMVNGGTSPLEQKYQLLFGGEFYFLFKKVLRMGIHASLIKPLTPTSPSLSSLSPSPTASQAPSAETPAAASSAATTPPSPNAPSTPATSVSSPSSPESPPVDMGSNFSTGYTIGPFVEYLWRCDPFILSLGSMVGYTHQHENSFLSVYPRMDLGFRFTQEFGMSFRAGYLMLFNHETFENPNKILEFSQVTLGVVATFGAF